MRHATPARLALALSIATASACGGSPSAWSSRAALPVPRADHALVGLRDMLYAIGGSSGSTLARVDRYDPASDTWTRRADMLSPRREFAAGALGGKIYVACGMSWTNPNAVTYVTTTEEYDPVADTWTARAPCPLDTPFNGVRGNVSIGGAAANGRLYLMVFNTNTFELAAMHAYDPGTDTWAAKASPPFSYASYSVAELGGALFLLAGRDFSPLASELAQYDPVGDFWIVRPSLPGVWGSALVGSSGKLYAVGRGVPGGMTMTARPDVYRYDPSTSSWSRAGWLPVARYNAGAAVLGSELYVTGGFASGDRYAPVPLANVEAASSP